MYMSRLTKQAISSWDYPVVSTTCGKVRGVAKEAGFIFRSVPYATSKRFMPPEPIQYENDLLLADHYTCVCHELLTPIPEDQHLCPHFYIPQDEDCLNLNIWTPTLKQDANRPVLVWLGHGDWSRGGANELFATDGENLSQFADIVVVAVNHRVNCLGGLDLSGYGAKYADSGRLCLLDMAAALRWVKDNIASFGGDPSCVTLYGHGAGAQKIFALMQMPELDGLYHRVFAGAAVPEATNTPQDADLMACLVMKHCNVSAPEKLEDMPYWFLAEGVLDAMEEFRKVTGKDYTWAPVADGKRFIGLAPGISLRPKTIGIPMLLGSSFGQNASNAYGAADRPMDDTQTITAFSCAYPDKVLRDLSFIDRSLRARILDFAVQQEQTKRKVWLYLFDLNVEIKEELTAWNGAELPFFFCNAEYIEAAFLPEITPQLQKKMVSALCAFMWTGSPAQEQFPVWAPAGKAGIPTMIFGAECRCCTGHDRDLQRLFGRNKEQKGESKR